MWLELSAPVRVQRPLREPLHTQRLGVDSDDPGHLIEQLLAPVPETRSTHDVYVIDAGLGLLATLGFAASPATPLNPADVERAVAPRSVRRLQLDGPTRPW